MSPFRIRLGLQVLSLTLAIGSACAEPATSTVAPLSEKTGTCTANLGLCTANLTTCSAQRAQAQADLATCRTDLATPPVSQTLVFRSIFAEQSFTIPPGITQIYVETWGAGGGGGGGSCGQGNAGGGGGGGASYLVNKFGQLEFDVRGGGGGGGGISYQNVCAPGAGGGGGESASGFLQYFQAGETYKVYVGSGGSGGDLNVGGAGGYGGGDRGGAGGTTYGGRGGAGARFLLLGGVGGTVVSPGGKNNAPASGGPAPTGAQDGHYAGFISPDGYGGAGGRGIGGISVGSGGTGGDGGPVAYGIPRTIGDQGTNGLVMITLRR